MKDYLEHCERNFFPQNATQSVVCVDALHQSQQLFSHVRTLFYLPGLNQY